MEKHHYWMVAIAFFVVAAPCERLCAQATPTVLNCDARKVTYSAFDASFGDKIVVRRTRRTDLLSAPSERKFSPQRTKWIVLKEPNFTKPGPWTTTVSVSGLSSDDPSLELSFVDHASGGAEAEWLNEKLLFVRVWWGRIVSTDLILNIEDMTFPYREMADYGDFIQSCK